MRNLNAYDKPMLFDRSHISELTYTYLYRTENIDSIYPWSLYDFEKYITVPTFIIHCRTIHYGLVKFDDSPVSGKERLSKQTEAKQFKHVIEDSNLPSINVYSHSYDGWRTVDDRVSDVYYALKQDYDINLDWYKS